MLIKVLQPLNAVKNGESGTEFGRVSHRGALISLNPYGVKVSTA